MHDTVILDASLPAVCLYGHRGYKTVGHGIYELEHNVKLVYEIMEKNWERMGHGAVQGILEHEIIKG